MNYGCIAERLGHSFSKIIHNKIDNYDYILHEVSKNEFDSFMKEKKFKGINVTIPYKKAVIPYLDSISENAEKIGAVNTIVNKNGRLYGYNTDFGGLKMLIKKADIDIEGQKVIITGTGGTSKTAFAVSESLGASEIIRVSRSGKDGGITYEELYAKHTDANIIINTTPCGMFPDNSGIPVDINCFQSLCGVVDVVFNPLSTNLVLAAKEKGIKASGGLYMLVAQAVIAAEIFMDKKYDECIIDQIYNELISLLKNIVLIGMPGCGKTTIGRELAKVLGKEFIDTDEYIVKKEGRDISEIFKKDGEEYFRNAEAEAIREISSKNKLIIGTGGGAVMRKENVNSLKQNGILVFLDRPLEKLIPTDDRPLANSAEKIKKLYSERISTYNSSADIVIETGDFVSDNIKKIMDKLEALK